tara:strand:+ start:800 stop:1456 length:657 start_codon:yes stop_codon:yes gene_type:complete
VVPKHENSQYYRKIILIGGTSHCGKTTLAKRMSVEHNIKLISTDSLAKHPGRPWKETPSNNIPEHVKDYYSKLSTKEMMASVLMHYEKLWPTIRDIIRLCIRENTNLIIEGSALLPKLIDHTFSNQVNFIWLTDVPENLRARIYGLSQYEEKLLEEKKMIDKFVDRTIAFDDFLTKDVKDMGLTLTSSNEIKHLESSSLPKIKNYTSLIAEDLLKKNS